MSADTTSRVTTKGTGKSQPGRSPSFMVCASPSVRPRRQLLGDIVLRFLRPGTEEEFLHLRDEEGTSLGLDGGQAVLVDEHRLVRDPLRPGLLRDIGIDALTELAGIGEVVETLGLAFQDHAMYT